MNNDRNTVSVRGMTRAVKQDRQLLPPVDREPELDDILRERNDALAECERLLAENESLRSELNIAKVAKGFHSVAVAERNLAWHQNEKLTAEVERLRAELKKQREKKHRAALGEES